MSKHTDEEIFPPLPDEVQIRVLALDPNALHFYCGQIDGPTESIVTQLLDNGAEINVTTKTGESALHAAVRARNSDIVQLLLQHGAYVDLADSQMATPLHLAASNGSQLILEALVRAAILRMDEHEDIEDQESPDFLRLADHYVNLPDADGNTALHFAALHGHEACVDALIARGAEVDASNEEERTPLHFGAEAGKDGVVDILVDEGAEIDTADKESNTPLHLAAARGHTECVGLLAAVGADVNAQNYDSMTPLHMAALNGRYEVVQLLLQGDEDQGWSAVEEVDAEDDFGRTPLHAAASATDLKSCRALLQKGAVLKKLDEDQRSAIIWVVHQKSRSLRDDKILQCLKQLWKWWEKDKSSDISQDHPDESGKNPLHYACYNGLTSCVKFLVGMKLDVMLPDKTGRTPLHYATASQASVQALLKYGGDARTVDHVGAYPVHMASYFSCVGALEEFLKTNADAITLLDQEQNTLFHYLANNNNITQSHSDQYTEFVMNKKRELLERKNNNGQTPIHVAAARGNVVFLRSVADNISKLEQSFYFVAKDAAGRTPLHIAAIHGHSNAFLYLVERGMDPNLASDAGLSPLHAAVVKNQVDFVKEVVGCDKLELNASDPNGRTPFFYACSLGFSDIIDLLIFESDIDLEGYTDHVGNTALHTAVLADQVGSVRLIMEEEIDELFTAQNQDGLTPLHLAAALGNLACLQELLKSDACPVNHTDAKGRTPLHYACHNGSAACVSALIEKEASVNEHDKEGNTPLFFAAFQGNLPCISYLIQNNAKTADLNEGGRTALHAVAWSGSVRGCETLVENNSSLLDKGCNNGRTALHRAASRGHIRVIEYLLSASADPDTPDSDGATPLILAAYYQRLEAVEYLLSHGADAEIKDELDRGAIQYAQRGAKNMGSNEHLADILKLLERYK